MSKNGTKRIFIPPALKSRNYQLFFGGQGLSLIGTWITQTATIWLVYHLTSSVWLGIVDFLGQIPSLVLAPFGELIVDRINRHRILVIRHPTQSTVVISSVSVFSAV